jgi:ferredoxin
MGLQIHVDRESCTGHAQCLVHGPDVFVLDDEGFNCAADQEIAPAYEAQATAGAHACPEQAIKLTTDPTDTP